VYDFDIDHLMIELVHATGMSLLIAGQYLQQLKDDIAKATEFMNKEIAHAAAQLRTKAGKAHDHRDREAVKEAIDLLTGVGKARLVAERLGL
jgi:hypothetical protein